jgi:UDP-N-acetylmuramate dehydrogenase
MNAGAHGGEMADVLVEARALDRQGRCHTFPVAAMDLSYRHCGLPEDMIFIEALFSGSPGDPAQILAAMDEIAATREATQPIRERTGGSTFRNPPGHKAWQLIDAAGCRGLVRGGAQMSTMHCNFLVNRGGATSADLEDLGDEVRQRVWDTSGISLEWEIRRIGQRLNMRYVADTIPDGH